MPTNGNLQGEQDDKNINNSQNGPECIFIKINVVEIQYLFDSSERNLEDDEDSHDEE